MHGFNHMMIFMQGLIHFSLIELIVVCEKFEVDIFLKERYNYSMVEERSMTVFYSVWCDGTRQISFIRFLGECICEDADISYWAVPGTLED